MKLSEALVEVWSAIPDPKALSKEAKDLFKALYKEVAILETEGKDFNGEVSNSN